MRTPSEQRGSVLSEFLDLRDSIRRERIGSGGREVCAELTAALDRSISALMDPRDGPMAIVALGGYGRGELSPHSDVDLMLLHDLEDPSSAAAVLFRPLWDARLRVGHSVRTVKEAAEAARERFETQTTLLTARLVAGSGELFDRLTGALARVTRARPLRGHLVDAERERRMATPYRLMAVDLKTGRGGLRALQAFEWESRREQLIGRFSSRHDLEADEARETLLQVRNALHSVTGRAHDLYSPELREAVARWLGRDAFEVAADLVTAMHSIDRLAEKKWPEVVEPPVERAQRRNRRRSGPAVSVRGDVAPTIDYLDRLLEAGDPGRAVFDELWEGGLLQDLLPEWGVVADLPQLEPFHQHPVDAHLWRTVDEMRSIIADDGHVGRIAGELGRPRLLRLAAFLHDIGKGHGGDHSRLGAEIAAVLAKRVALDRDEAEMLNRAVEHHLLLPITATRRDLADPAVIDQVSEEVGSLEMLQVLYLLTIADSRATGPTMWSAWKATLLRTLFLRCAARFGAAESEPVGTTREDVLSAAGGSVDPVIAHLDAMPDSYLQTVTVDEVLWHSQLANDLSGPCNLGVRDASPADAVAVVGAGAIGFRRTVSAVFAANGIDVLEARMFGRSDGLVVDSFRVRDDRTGGRVSRERWDRIRSDLDAGLRGELDADDRLAARAAAYPASDLSLPLPTAAVSTDPASGDLVVVVKCSDRIGRLAEILGVLEGHGLEIRLAKLDSREGEVIDTFHVAPVRSIADLDLDELGKTVAAEIEP